MRLLLAILLAAPLPVLAQDTLTERGTLLVGGTAGVTRFNNQGTSATSVALSPRLGVFVTDALAVGASVSASYSRYSFEAFFDGTERTSSRTSLGVAPFATYYLGSPEGSVRPYLGASVGVRNQTIREVNSFGSPTVSTTDVQGDFSAGALLRLGDNVGLTGEAFYEWFETLENSQYGLRGGIAVFLGR